MVLVLRPEDTRGLLSMAEAIEATRTSFRDWREHAGVNAPRRRTHVPSGVRVSVHQGGTPTLGMTGLFTHCELIRPEAEEQVLEAVADPAWVLFDAKTAALTCVILGEVTPSECPDIRVPTGLRTAATSAVGTDLLARSDATTVGVFGGGGQSRYHLLALAALRSLREIKVYRRDPVERRKFASDMTEMLHTEVIPVTRPEEAVRGLDIIIAATNSSVPVFEGVWLEPGQHVTSIVASNIGLVQGGFTSRKRRELDDTTVGRMDVIVATSREQAIQDQQGDLYDPVQSGVIGLEAIHELSDLVSGISGRTSPEQITLFKNNAGQGITDVAIGARLYARARERGLGLEWPLGVWLSRES
jgi:ornithine cyclodeaminase/alanine dehydrogenase-like protein (mu-crystallin family)